MTGPSADAGLTDREGNPAPPGFAELHDAWRRLKGARRWPARREIRPQDFRRQLPSLFLADVISASPLEVRYRLVGTRLVGALGRDPTGRMLDEMPFLFRWFARRAYSALLRDGLPRFDRVTVLEGLRIRPIRYNRLLLPLGDDDERIEAVLGMIRPEDDDLPKAPAPYLLR